MAVLDRAKEFLLPTEEKIPSSVKQRLKRGREEMLRDAAKRRLCVKFERGETYWFLNKRSQLVEQGTTFDLKPDWRIRNQYNYIRPIVDGKVSAATQRIPGYEVLPTSTDPDKVAAAKLAEAVATYGFDKWRIRDASINVVKLAIAGGGEGFAMPYFDPNVGPYHQVQGDNGQAKFVGEGEIKVRVFNGNEVYWENSVDFDDSRWWATEQAVPIDVVQEYEGYVGGELTADAGSSDIPSDRQGKGNLVMVTEYYERPCPDYPRGRKIRIANGRLICPPEDYPLQDASGQVLDEPIIHRLVYTHDSDGKRDLGLVWQLIDFQRTAQDCINKLLEWKNRCLNPQMMAPVGANLQRPSDESGRINYYRPVSGLKPEWERPPQIPTELFTILNTAKSDMRDVASDEQIEAAPDVAAKSIQQVLETSRARWASFLGDYADWHSRVMRHCLVLVAKHYTEERTLQIRGRFSPYPLPNFLGAHLLDEQDVRVNPTSLQVRSRKEIVDQVMAFAQNGWITPDAAMAAINGGVGAEKFVESYELDVARINRIIQKIRDESVMDMPARTQNDPLSGTPMENVPGFMPDEQDNLAVWKSILSDWMKTEEFDQTTPAMQEVARNILAGIQWLEAQRAQRAAETQAAQAEQLGMKNAAAPQGPKPLPSMSKPENQGDQGSSDRPGPSQ